MHDLFYQVLTRRDLSKAGDLFTLADADIAGDLTEVLQKIEEIATAQNYLNNDNNQSVVEICITRVTSAIRWVRAGADPGSEQGAPTPFFRVNLHIEKFSTGLGKWGKLHFPWSEVAGGGGRGRATFCFHPLNVHHVSCAPLGLSVTNLVMRINLSAHCAKSLHGEAPCGSVV